MWCCDECELKGTQKCRECQEAYQEIQFEIEMLFEDPENEAFDFEDL